MPAPKRVTLALGGHLLPLYHLRNCFRTFVTINNESALGSYDARYTLEWTRFSRIIERFRLPAYLAINSLDDDENCLSMRELLSTTRNFTQATDPRDIIYSLLSLAPDYFQTRIRPEYTITCAEVYKRAASVLYPGDHRILYDAPSERRNIPGLPSFVPDWSVPGSQSIYEYKKSTPSGCPFRAGGNEKPQIAIDASYSSLRINGVVVDSVFLVGNAYEKTSTLEPKTARSWLEDFRNLYAIFEVLSPNSQKAYRTEREIFCSLVFAPIAQSEPLQHWIHPPANFEPNESTESEPASSNPDESRRPASIFHFFQTLHILPEASSQIDEDTMVRWKYIRILNNVSANRRGFVTKGGYIGLGPFTMQRGDVLCVFLGVEIPFIIRKQEDGRYMLTGDAYASGIMHGEILSKPYSVNIIDLS
jgi:hypothetical protein